jgi:hypothetical protein
MTLYTCSIKTFLLIRSNLTLLLQNIIERGTNCDTTSICMVTQGEASSSYLYLLINPCSIIRACATSGSTCVFSINTDYGLVLKERVRVPKYVINQGNVILPS